MDLFSEKLWDLGRYSLAEILKIDGEIRFQKFLTDNFDFDLNYYVQFAGTRTPVKATIYSPEEWYSAVKWHRDNEEIERHHIYMAVWASSKGTEIRDKSKRIYQLTSGRLYLLDNMYWQHRVPPGYDRFKHKRCFFRAHVEQLNCALAQKKQEG